MKIVKPRVRVYRAGHVQHIMTAQDGMDMVKSVEIIGRTCYKSEQAMTDKTTETFVKGLIRRGEESPLEHCSISAHIICDRGVSHEIVRHRLAAYSQESTRYCNYTDGKFGSEITVVDPTDAFRWDANVESDWRRYCAWKDGCEHAEHSYFTMVANGARPQEARDVLPHSLKTEIWVTYDLHEWRHFLKLRTSRRAHPQMREVAIKALTELYAVVPYVFDDIAEEVFHKNEQN